MEEKKAVSIDFRLTSFETIKFGFEYPKVEPDLADKEYLSFQTTPKISYAIESNWVIVDFNIISTVKKTQERFMEIETKFVYEVTDLKKHVFIENGAVKYNDISFQTFLITITGASYSTMRGIMSEKLNGTVLRGYMLPIINPSVFFAKIPQ